MKLKHLAEIHGEIVATRVLAADEGKARTELSYAGAGTLDGTPINDVITYVSIIQPDGLLAGSADGVITAHNGDIAVWHGTGVGRTKGKQVSWTCSLTIQSSSSTFGHLNGVVAAATFDVAENGKVAQAYWAMH
ncbi:hypothetical protein ABZ383_08700 [Streptomyces sp. NPDC005900]|uniref:hypothetical protein n=1 Tax=unclassified Streptomyces TaxID=2593676 RepID=UPI0033CBC753